MWVDPQRKGATDGRGTVTGAPEDVAEALVELKKVLCRAAEPADLRGQKTKKATTHAKARGQENTKRGSGK